MSLSFKDDLTLLCLHRVFLSVVSCLPTLRYKSIYADSFAKIDSYPKGQLASRFFEDSFASVYALTAHSFVSAGPRQHMRETRFYAYIYSYKEQTKEITAKKEGDVEREREIENKNSGERGTRRPRESNDNERVEREAERGRGRGRERERNRERRTARRQTSLTCIRGGTRTATDFPYHSVLASCHPQSSHLTPPAPPMPTTPRHRFYFPLALPPIRHPSCSEQRWNV